MTQQFLNGPQVSAAGQQMGCKTVAQGMRCRRFRQSHQVPQATDLPLHNAGMEALAGGARLL